MSYRGDQRNKQIDKLSKTNKHYLYVLYKNYPSPTSHEARAQAITNELKI